MEQIDIPQERRYCSKLGFSVLAIMLWSILWQFGLYWLDGWILPFRMPETLYYLLLLVGHYAVSLPIVFCIWRKTPPMPFCRERAGAKRMGRWFVIGCALMWLGSLIGTNINDMVYALTGRDPVGMVDESFSQMPMAAIVLGACIIGPLCEELVFRGLLAGRLARYGQKPGAFISALLFGLYHANLEQFFYAFALGLLLSYAYYRTGLLRTSVLLHMLFNIIGSVVPMLLPDTIAAQSALGLFWMAMLVIGMILLFAALCLRWVRAETVRPAARFLLGAMALFFVPYGVGLMDSYRVILENLWAIVVSGIVSTVLVLFVTGKTFQSLNRRARLRHIRQQRNHA